MDAVGGEMDRQANKQFDRETDKETNRQGKSFFSTLESLSGRPTSKPDIYKIDNDR